MILVYERVPPVTTRIIALIRFIFRHEEGADEFNDCLHFLNARASL